MVRAQDTNEPPLRILIATSEAVPFSKTGGLADVTTALAQALAKKGAEVSLFVPLHRLPSKDLPKIHDSGLQIQVPVGDRTIPASIKWASLGQAKVFFVDCPDYFDRDGLYGAAGHDYGDNSARFAFFSRAVLVAARQMVLRPHVIHCNDWQTGLIPALLRAEYRGTPGFERTGCVFTIHNLAYQGRFWSEDMNLTGLDWSYFNFEQMEFHGELNLLKTGITLCDRITTVSPTYAQEIQTPEFGNGLDEVLQHHKSKLSGILNGIDRDVWNPATDSLISDNYDVNSVHENKPKCKRVLQETFDLPQRSDIPLVGMVSRMSTQKGFDIIAESAERFLQHDLQLCVLGTGDPSCEDMMRHLARQHPEKVSVRVQFDETLAHRIEAGSDIFLMPSRYEPCGLNQMYSLTYGTVPLVRATGGLADSVVDTTTATLANKTATGFSFEEYTADALAETFDRAIQLFGDKPAWQQVIETGMHQDWSWDQSAAKYEAVYRQAMNDHA